MTVNSTKSILQDFSDRHGLPDGITTIFYNSLTREEIGYSFDYEDEPFVFVDMCSDLKKIWEIHPDAISWDGLENGIIGYSGPHVVYNVEQAEERYAEDNGIDLSEAIEHWDFNVEGTAKYVSSATRPYHMYEIYD